MIGQRKAWESQGFRDLVNHFARFDKAERGELARLYRAANPEPETLALELCRAPEVLIDALPGALRSARTRSLLEDVVLEHDLAVRVEWADKLAVRALSRIGVLARVDDSALARQVSAPGVIAAILSSQIKGVRPSLYMLLGRESEDRVASIASRYGVASGPLIAMILELTEHFRSDEMIDSMLSNVAEPDWLGGALMATELGGMCYWQEVFGTGIASEDAAGEQGAKILPLMRDVDRRSESSIADTLCDMGLIFKLDEVGVEHPMLAVPEELWHNLWSLGRTWLIDWVSFSFDGVIDGMLKRPLEQEVDGLQRRLKWLCCEAQNGRLKLPMDEPNVAPLIDVSALPMDACLGGMAMGIELGVLAPEGDDRLVVDPSRVSVLDEPRAAFARQSLLSWCMGGFGQGADRWLAQAIGLDDPWRLQVLDSMLELLDGHVPAWLLHEGIDSQLTGMGYLRTLDTSTPELLTLEVGMVNSYICGAKLLWIDLLSMLEDGRWYSVAALDELMQLVAALTLFNHLAHVLEHPGMSHYLPVQRASFLTDPHHVSAFGGWVRAIFEEVFAPLGVARVDGDRVWLSTKWMRIPSPEGLEVELREAALREIFGDDELVFSAASHVSPLRAVRAAPVPGAGALSLDESVEFLLEQTLGKQIKTYDGKSLVLADERS